VTVTSVEAPARTDDRARPGRARLPLAVVALGLALVVAVALSIALGARDVSLAQLVSAIGGHPDGVAGAAIAERVPRTALGLVVGAALGLSGAVMQAATRNPLADPGILGINGGAALAVVIGIAFLGVTSPWGYLGLALAGAAGAALLVGALGSAGRGGPTPLRLTLAGAVTAAAIASVTSAILLPRVDVMLTFRFWQVGSLGGARWDSLLVVLPLVVAGAVVALASARRLDALALGDELAAGLGVQVGRTRLVALAGAVALCAAATSVAGPIGFVGLAVPHVVRLLAGSAQRRVLPLSMLGGAVLLLVADVIGRIVARPAELEVGVVTALIGAPVLILLARRRRVRGL
jgi:iron complex transport system permease protein